MESSILKENHPKIAEFLAKGNGLLVTDTYLGFRPVRAIKDSNNVKLGVVFLIRPNDPFQESTLKELGPFVLGVYEEEMEDHHLDDLIAVAVKFESEVDPAISLGD
jgi:hypothetical protein